MRSWESWYPKKTHSLTDLCCQDCKKLVVMETLANSLDIEIVELKDKVAAAINFMFKLIK